MLTLTLLTLMTATKPVALRVGHQKVLNLTHACAPVVSDTRIAEAHELSAQQVLIVGNAEGTTTVSFPCGSQKVLVTIHQSAEAQLADARNRLANLPIAAMWLDACSFSVHCPKCDGAQLTRIEEVRALYPCVKEAVIRAKKRPAADVVNDVKRELGDDTQLTVEVTKKGQVVLYGAAKSLEEKNRVDSLRTRFPMLAIDVH